VTLNEYICDDWSQPFEKMMWFCVYYQLLVSLTFSGFNTKKNPNLAVQEMGSTELPRVVVDATHPANFVEVDRLIKCLSGRKELKNGNQ